MLIEHSARVDVKDHNGDEPVHAADIEGVPALVEVESSVEEVAAGQVGGERGQQLFGLKSSDVKW